jgi:hypothetical protein
MIVLRSRRSRINMTFAKTSIRVPKCPLNVRRVRALHAGHLRISSPPVNTDQYRDALHLK